MEQKCIRGAKEGRTDQIIFGSIDWTYYMLVLLAMRLKHATLERNEVESIPMFEMKKSK